MEEEFTLEDLQAAQLAEEEVSEEDLLAAALAAEGEPKAAPPPQVGGGETFLNRAVNTLPLGRLTTDSISALVLQALRPEPGAVLTPQARAELAAMGEQVEEPEAPGLVDDYRAVRDTRRLRTAAGSEQNPNAARAGTAAGIGLSILAPLPRATVGQGATGRIGSAALTGAGYGALSGATDGDADLTRGDVGGTVLDTLQGGAVGGLIGAGTGGLVEAARPLAGALRRYAVEQGRKVIQGNSDIAAATRRPLAPEAVEEVLEQGAIRPFSTTQRTYGRIDQLAEEQGAVYGEIIEQLERRGVQGPEARRLADELMERYQQEFLVTGANKSAPREFQRQAQNIERITAPPPGAEGPVSGRLGLRQAESVKRDLQQRARFDRLRSTGNEEALQEISSRVRQANEDAITEAAMTPGVSPEVQALASRFVPTKQRLGKLLEARTFAERGASKADQRSSVGLKDVIFGAGASGGEPLSGLALSQLSSVARNRGPSTLAAGSFGLARGLETGNLSQELATGLGGAAELAAEEVQSRADRADIPPDMNPLTAALIRALRNRRAGGEAR